MKQRQDAPIQSQSIESRKKSFLANLSFIFPRPKLNEAKRSGMKHTISSLRVALLVDTYGAVSRGDGNIVSIATRASACPKHAGATAPTLVDQFRSRATLLDQYPLKRLLDDIQNKDQLIQAADGSAVSIKELVDQAKKIVDQLLCRELAARPQG